MPPTTRTEAADLAAMEVLIAAPDLDNYEYDELSDVLYDTKRAIKALLAADPICLRRQLLWRLEERVSFLEERIRPTD